MSREPLHKGNDPFQGINNQLEWKNNSSVYACLIICTHYLVKEYFQMKFRHLIILLGSLFGYIFRYLKFLINSLLINFPGKFSLFSSLLALIHWNYFWRVFWYAEIDFYIFDFEIYSTTLNIPKLGFLISWKSKGLVV